LFIPQFSHIIVLINLKVLMVAIDMTDEILTIQEIAEYLKLNEKTAYRLASEGKLPGFKVGGSWRFKRVDLEKWIEEQKDKLI
jgi:excisionase family DNA binding protein